MLFRIRIDATCRLKPTLLVERDSIMSFYLKPKKGWNLFEKHKALIDSLYAVFMPLVNKSDWSYHNFTSDTAIFEDGAGNTIYLEFEKQEERINNMVVSIKENIGGKMDELVKRIASEYDLDNLSHDR